MPASHSERKPARIEIPFHYRTPCRTHQTVGEIPWHFPTKGTQVSRTVIVGVNQTETAAAAGRRAAELARDMSADLLAVCAYDKYELETVRAGSDEFSFSTETEALETAEQLAASLRAEVPGVTITPRAAEGKAAEALVRTAEAMDAQVIVVGNKRVQGLGRVLGSIANEVARKAPCDVYIAHTH